jgi:transcriptional regulator with XRE-family HTH domain
MSRGVKSLAEIVGHNILNRRKKRKLTQEALADMVGIGQQSLSRMEKGRIAPRFDRLQRFAEMLGCTVADLFKEGEVSGSAPLAGLQSLMRPLSASSQQVVVNIAFEVASAMLKLERTT